jgi:hypothetical protein
MALQVTNGVGQFRLRNSSNQNQVSLDTDAQAFITAAGITNTTQVDAVKELVLDLKAAGIWTKMKALYPLVGGTATSHKFNLKDPRDLNVAYRLTFYGGWTHTSTGAQASSALNGYANTFLTPTSALTLNNVHLSVYTRTNSADNGDLGASTTSNVALWILGRNSFFCYDANTGGDSPRPMLADSAGFRLGSRTTSTNAKMYFRNTIIGTKTTTSIGTQPNIPIYLGAINSSNTTTTSRTNKEYAFASIGDGLTDTEATIFYQIVEKFQVALGRNISTLSVYYNRNYDSNTNLFLLNAGITNTTQQSAVGTLVNTLKTAGIWTKMKAVYPMVGGTSTSHSYNLVNSSLYNLTFSGGWTFSNSGSTPNGSTSFANTGIVPASVLNSSSLHMSYYSRSTNPITNLTGLGIGCLNAYPNPGQALYMHSWNSNTLGTGTNTMRNYISSTWQYGGGNLNLNLSSERGLIMGNRQSASGFNVSKNGVTQGSLSAASYLPANQAITPQIYIGAVNSSGTATYYSTYQCAFASIGDGLTDAEATTFYNAVQAFQTTLGRQV